MTPSDEIMPVGLPKEIFVDRPDELSVFGSWGTDKLSYSTEYVRKDRHTAALKALEVAKEAIQYALDANVSLGIDDSVLKEALATIAAIENNTTTKGEVK